MQGKTHASSKRYSAEIHRKKHFEIFRNTPQAEEDGDGSALPRAEGDISYARSHSAGAHITRQTGYVSERVLGFLYQKFMRSGPREFCKYFVKRNVLNVGMA